MKILQIHNKIPYPPKDGGSIAVFNLTSGFVNAGNKVDILAFNTKKHFVKTDNFKHNLSSDINIFEVFLNTDLKPLKALFNLFFSKLPYNAARFINNKFKKKLINKLQLNSYDLIQIEGLYMMPYIDVIKKYTESKIAYRAHNIEHKIWEQTVEKEKSILKKLYLKIILKRMNKFELSFVNKYDFLVPISILDADYWKKAGNTKPVFVSQTGLNAEEYKPEHIDFSEIKLYFIGSLDWYPNQEGLIWFIENIWNSVSKIYPEQVFSIAGRNAPENFIKKLKSYKNLNYLGEIENAKAFMQKNNVMIVPLLSGSGMRIKIIEGMASGNIILSTSKGAEGINGKHLIDFIIADTPENFKNSLINIIENNYPCKQISNNAQHFILNNFDNFALSNSLLDFYQSVLKTEKS
jgi:hypothetical protein